MRAKKDIIEEVREVSSVGTSNHTEYMLNIMAITMGLLLEVHCDIRDQLARINNAAADSGNEKVDYYDDIDTSPAITIESLLELIPSTSTRTRLRKAFEKLNINNLADLLGKTSHDFLGCYNCGEMTLASLKEALSKWDLKLKGDR